MNETPLHAEHLRLGGRMVEFAGFHMPVQYSGVKAEHLAVRTGAGLFDVSHMGEVEVRGPAALDFVQHITCNNAARLKDGRAQYTAMLTERGTFVDDLLVYRVSEDFYLLVVNASNTDKDFQWMVDHNPMGADLTNCSDRYGQIAVQGPGAVSIVQKIVTEDLSPMRPFRFIQTSLVGHEAILSRTGYTGEDGFEIYCRPDGAEPIWKALLEAGGEKGLTPCGLGARDTLRLEACLMLYGNDIDDDHSAWEADLAWIVKPDKGDFVGRDALLRQKEAGLTRKLVGFEIDGKGIARHGHTVVEGETVIGEVTSGTMLPFLDRAMGLAYVPMDKTEEGTPLTLDVRGRPLQATVVATPFYKRPKKENA